jgi:hypothetical protein
VENRLAHALLDGEEIIVTSQNHISAMGWRTMIRLFVVEKDCAIFLLSTLLVLLVDYVSVPLNGHLFQVAVSIQLVLVPIPQMLVFVVEKELVWHQIVVHAMLPSPLV